MKEYFKRITQTPKKWELIYWWILRAMMIFAVFDSMFGLGFQRDEPDIQQVLQTIANLVAMFAWEVFMMFSEKSWPRYCPTYIQDFTIFFIWCASFGGAYLNWYYSVNLMDILLHTISGGFCVIGGYELVTCMQKRDKKACSVNVVLLCALGIGFIAGNVWEMFEFTFDQIANGDSQHWSKALAEEAASIYGNVKLASPNYIPELVPERYAIMDTMEDMLCNCIGSLVVYIGLRIKPYNHIGECDVNKLYAQQLNSLVTK